MTFQKIPFFCPSEQLSDLLVLGVVKIIAKRFTLENNHFFFFFKILHLLDTVFQSNVFIEIMRGKNYFFLHISKLHDLLHNYYLNMGKMQNFIKLYDVLYLN